MVLDCADDEAVVDPSYSDVDIEAPAADAMATVLAELWLGTVDSLAAVVAVSNASVVPVEELTADADPDDKPDEVEAEMAVCVVVGALAAGSVAGFEVKVPPAAVEGADELTAAGRLADSAVMVAVVEATEDVTASLLAWLDAATGSFVVLPLRLLLASALTGAVVAVWLGWALVETLVRTAKSVLAVDSPVCSEVLCAFDVTVADAAVGGGEAAVLGALLVSVTATAGVVDGVVDVVADATALVAELCVAVVPVAV